MHYQIAITRKRKIFLSFESDLQIIEGTFDYGSKLNIIILFQVIQNKLLLAMCN